VTESDSYEPRCPAHARQPPSIEELEAEFPPGSGVEVSHGERIERIDGEWHRIPVAIIDFPNGDQIVLFPSKPEHPLN
jgi:hypothetical protein